MRPHQVDLVPSLPSVGVVGEQLKRSEARREVKRLRQIAQAHRTGTKRKRTDGETDEAEPNDVGAGEEEGIKGKRAKTEEAEDGGDVQMISAAPISTPHTMSEPPETEPEPTKMSVSKAFPEVRGHTSYLTFAVLLPACVETLATPIEVNSPASSPSDTAIVS